MLFNDKVYTVLKYIAMYVLPALGTLYFAIASIWNLPYGEQVLGTITAVDTFLGVILGISTSSYNAVEENNGSVADWTIGETDEVKEEIISDDN